MTPHLANWYAGPQPWSTIYGLPLRLAPTRDGSTRHRRGSASSGAGLTMPWLASLDRGAVEAHCVGLARRLRAEFELPPVESAIVSLPFADAADAAARLRSAGIMASVRAGAVRVGFHLYNTEDDLQRLLDALVD